MVDLSRREAKAEGVGGHLVHDKLIQLNRFCKLLFSWRNHAQCKILTFLGTSKNPSFKKSELKKSMTCVGVFGKNGGFSRRPPVCNVINPMGTY